MTRYHSFAFFVLAVVACGPAEILPPPSDAGTPTNDAGETCDGVCLPGPPAGWFGPYLLWKGKEADAPDCLDVTVSPGIAFTGYTYPSGTPLCGPCKCAPPIGSCELPATLTTAAASCADNGPSVEHLSFDPPADWTGTCTAENAISAGKLCGGVPCVQSVTIAPLTMTQGGCLPIQPSDVKPPLELTILGRACGLGMRPACTAGPGLCMRAAPGPEFKQCISYLANSGFSECPPTYPNRNIFYPDPDPSCSPCACDAPVGSSCTGLIKVSAASACSPSLLPAISLDAENATCVDLPPGSALGSKSAMAPSYHGGSCTPSGGVPEIAVFCCQP
ncbi:MAG: hypothetical protein ABI134_08280 [Byssovorax sp.]